MNNNSRKSSRSFRGIGRRAASLILALCMVAGMLTVVTPEASAAHWAQPYMDKLLGWGIIRRDIEKDRDPAKSISRAEVCALLNRAYGFSEVGPVPFEDIPVDDPYYEDICIAYTMGYFTGTTEKTASPTATLTREQAVALFGRILMFEKSTGETLGFKDSHQFSSYSRGMVAAAVDAGIIAGYPDGTFRPANQVTRGEFATMLVRALGMPIRDKGDYTLGSIYGNVTISKPNVELENTTIFGDLYISGGIGLSDLKLVNVEVVGKIIVAGAGESEKGENSILLRNVIAEELVVDSFVDQFITVQSDGLTLIENVTVKSSAYLEDLTDNGLGLLNIRLDAEAGSQLYLSGNIKEVVNVTPSSTMVMAKGIASEITVDEKAVGSTLILNNQTVTEDVNLDTATTVTGSGDVEHMDVNAGGSTVEMLPTTITVRPGLNAEVYGEVMDTIAAQESSEDPRFLSGYPTVTDITTKGATVLFETNKRGTIYWALTAMTDGSVSEKDLLKPSSNGVIIKSGTLAATSSYTEFSAKLSGLTKDGSYYVSAVLVDNRGMSSPVKVAAFVTPDDTTPAFASGYPTVSVVTDKEDEQIVQALVMPNKNCRLYYAIYPKGATAPTAEDFRANALTGNLGRGVVDVQKNTPYLVPKVNHASLQEETDYDVYLWLCDTDGLKGSQVKKITITTLDQTPPTIMHITETDVTAKSVKLSFALNESGMLYWAVVKSGTQFYVDGVTAGSREAMAQIENGINALKSGSTKVSKSKVGKDVTFTVSGLEAQTAYDLYYVAKDDAGNYCIYTANLTPPKTIYTLDNQPPTVKQEFTHDGSSDSSNLTPYPDTSVNLVFSENIKGIKDRDGDGKNESDYFLELYKQRMTGAITPDEYAAILRLYVKLYVDGQKVTVRERNGSNDGLGEDGKPDPTEAEIQDWVIDYRYVKIEQDSSGSGQVYMTFVHNNADLSKSALNLAGGETYYFTLEDIADTSTASNRMKGSRGITKLDKFTTISAQLKLSESSDSVPAAHDGLLDDNMTVEDNTEQKWYFDMVFAAEPLANEAMSPDIYWDMVIWSSTSVYFKLYMKELQGEDATGKEVWSDWTQIGVTDTVGPDDAIAKISGSKNSKPLGVSIGAALMNNGFEKVQDMKERLYAIEIVYMGTGGSGRNWNTPVTLEVTAITGNWNALQQAGTKLTQTSSSYESVVENNERVSDITVPAHFSMTKIFVDNTPPKFNEGYPTFTAGDSSVTLRVTLDRPNSKFYYVIAPREHFDPELVSGKYQYEDMPTGGIGTTIIDGAGKVEKLVEALNPNSDGIRDYHSSDDVVTGEGSYDGVSVSTVVVSDLKPVTEYIVFIVLQGESQDSLSNHPYIFRFSTGDVARPKIELYNNTSSVGVRTSEEARASWFTMEMHKLEATAPFNYVFCRYIDGYTADADGNPVKPSATEDTPYAKFANAGYAKWESMTVLEALTASLGANDPTSLFDQYAGTEIYNIVYEAVVSTTGYAERRDQGNLETEKKKAEDEKTQMASVSPDMDAHPATYYFVIGAQNLLSSGNKDYAFKAISAIHLPDTTPPSATQITKVTGCSKVGLTGDAIYDPDRNTLPGAYSYEGTVQIVFSETPYRYYLDDKGAPQKVLLESMTEEDLIKFVGTSGTITGAKVDGNALTLNFKGIRSNGTILLFNQGFVSDSNGNTNMQSGQPCYLKLTFYAGKSEDGTAVELNFDMNWVLK